MSWPKLDTKQWYRLIIASALTLAIVLILILLPLQATALDITISGATTSDKPDTMCLTASLSFQTSERIPITNVEAIISGATDVTIQFDVNGNIASVTGDLTESYIGASISKMESYNYGYGYRIGYENSSQYDFGYGYGYSASATVVRYVICFDAEYLNPGDHNFQVQVNTGELVNPSFSSDLHAFHITGTSLTLTTGWNEYTWKRSAATLSQIDTIMGLGGFGSNEALSKWDNTTKAFGSYISGLGGNNPTVNPGDPVWVAVTSEKSFEM